MTHECDFRIGVRGEIAELRRLVGFMTPAVEKRASYFGDYVLNPGKLVPAKDTECSVALRGTAATSRFVIEENNGWSHLFLSRDDEAIDRHRQECQAQMQRERARIDALSEKFNVDLWPARVRILGYDDSVETDVPPVPSLLVTGACGFGPPVTFVEQLSALWTAMEFSLFGITDHHLTEGFECKGGVARCVHHRVEDIQQELVMWVVKDGVRIPDPIYLPWELLDD